MSIQSTSQSTSQSTPRSTSQSTPETTPANRSNFSNSVVKPAILALALVLSSSFAFAAATDNAETSDLGVVTGNSDAVITKPKPEAKKDAKKDSKNSMKDAKKETHKEAKKSESKDKKKGDKAVNPHVIMETSLGNVEIELFEDKAPISVANFLKYTDEGYYNGTIFHRVIPNFMIQGGGFTEKMDQKKTADQIKNEANNGLKNDRGTLAMARTAVVDSATSQFFVNVKDNDFLNFTAPNPAQYGYAVFGKVVSGMDIVDKIKEVPTGNKGQHSDVPNTPVVIKSMKRQ